MKKMFASLCAVAAVSFISGCSMCTAPIPGDQSCVEATHMTDFTVKPSPLAFTAPAIAPCTDIFRPTFRAGESRITVTGVGENLDEATSDAVAKFLETARCDYIVAVSRRVSMKTHPTWRFFATTNYTVTFSGLPIFLDKLEKVLPPPPPPAGKFVSKDEFKTTVNALDKRIVKLETSKSTPAESQASPLGILKLTDINVQIQAKGATPDNVGMTFPAPAGTKYIAK